MKKKISEIWKTAALEYAVCIEKLHVLNAVVRINI